MSRVPSRFQIVLCKTQMSNFEEMIMYTNVSNQRAAAYKNQWKLRIPS